jgi:hypothetical protein
MDRLEHTVHLIGYGAGRYGFLLRLTTFGVWNQILMDYLNVFDNTFPGFEGRLFSNL